MRIGVLRAILSFSILALAACGMNKPTSLSHIAYHDLTARYNRYFNSKLLLQGTETFFQESHKDNYEELLPLYIIGSEETAQSVYGDMDEVIKKASANIKLHENSKWTDDAYYHIGMANFYKRDYAEALKAFVFVTSEFDEGLRMKERKKKSKKKKKRTRAQAEKERNTNEYYDESMSFAKHKPAKYPSILMIIRAYTHLKEWDKAQSIISLSKGDRKFPDDLKEKLAVATTNYHIARKDYNNAIGSLTEAILLAEKKEDKRRYTFLLAQLHRRANLNQMAIQYFTEVLDMNPDFEMEFQAKIKIAKISKEENLTSNREVIALLLGMLKEDKYRMFKGEIYFTLAEIYLKEGRIEEAVKNFLASVENSRDNQEQQAMAFLQLAELYYVKEEYKTSQVYHDSTLAVLPVENELYDDLSERNGVLKDLVRNMDIIATQDSLQYLASLSEEELNKFVAEQEKKAREKAQAEAEAAEEQAGGGDSFNPLINNRGGGTSAWPFDDPNLKSRGFSTFQQRWGERPRVDFWRISSKANNLLAGQEEEEEKSEEEGGAEAEEEGFSLGELPKSPEALEASNQKIMDAYFNLGNLYKDQIENRVRALAAFETLMTRYPDNPYRLETAYTLYLIYQESDPDKALKYKQMIIKDFPESIIAKVLQNPNYIQEAKEQENEVQNYYATTYDFFTQDDLMTALERKKRAEQLFPNNPLQPKFDMLEALIYGKMGKYDTCKVTLQKIVNNYPNDEVQPKAVTMLNLLEGRDYEVNAGNIEANMYTLEPETQHFMCVLIKNSDLDITNLQTKIAQFNDEFFRLSTIGITPVILNNDLQMILLKSFDNADKAKTYYNTIRYNKSVFSGIAEEDYDVFYISKRNYGVFFRQKDIVNYMTFFTQKYLRQQ